MTLLRLVFLVIAFAGGGFAASADISRVQVVGNGEPTRITVWADSEQEGRAFLAQSGEARSLIVPIQGDVTPAAGDGRGGVATWALSEGTLSFALDRPLMVARVLALPPAGNEPSHRIIIDLQAVSDARFSSVAKRDMRKLASFRTTGARANWPLNSRHCVPMLHCQHPAASPRRPIRWSLMPGMGARTPARWR